MSEVIASIAAIGVALVILGAVAYALFEATPFARHVDRFRDGQGTRIGSSPRLD